MSELPAGQGCDLTSAAGIENGWDSQVDNRCALKSQARRRLRRQHCTRLLHRLGERATDEFVDEIVRHYPEIEDDLDRRLERYAGLDAAILSAVGGDCFAPSPTRAVGGAQ